MLVLHTNTINCNLLQITLQSPSLLRFDLEEMTSYSASTVRLFILKGNPQQTTNEDLKQSTNRNKHLRINNCFIIHPHWHMTISLS